MSVKDETSDTQRPLRVWLACNPAVLNSAISEALASIPGVDTNPSDSVRPDVLVVTPGVNLVAQAKGMTVVLVDPHEPGDFMRAVETISAIASSRRPVATARPPAPPQPSRRVPRPGSFAFLLARPNRGRLIMSLAVIAAAASLVATTMAAFNATTINSSTFTSGTLILSDAKTSGTTCFSSGTVAGGTVTAGNSTSVGCDDLIGATLQVPGATPTASVVTLKNAGSVPAASFKLTAAVCSAANNAETYHGTDTGSGATSMCAHINVTLHDNTNNTCVYPAGAGACPALANTSNLNTFSTGAPTYTLSTTNMAAGGSTAYTLTTQLDGAAATNLDQGLVATMTLTWVITT